MNGNPLEEHIATNPYQDPKNRLRGDYVTTAVLGDRHERNWNKKIPGEKGGAERYAKLR